MGYHFHAAEVWEKTLIHALEAGDLAHRGNATVEALVHDRRALDAALALRDPRAAALHRRCGQALALLGDFEQAHSHLDDALRLARSNGDPAAEQDLLFDLAGLYASRDYPTAEWLAIEALAAARRIGDRRREALTLNRLGNIVTNRMRFADGRSLHEEARAHFEALGDPWGSADALDLIGMARYLAGEVSEARAAFARAAAIFTELDDLERRASALTTRGLYLAVLDGPCATDAGPAEYRHDAERGLRLCQDLGWRAGEAYARVALACAALGDGRYGDAASEATAALAIADEIDHQQWRVIALFTLGLLHADLLDDKRAASRFRQALNLARTVGSAQWVGRLDAWLARCQARGGDRAAAVAALAQLVPSRSRPASISQRRSLTTLAEVALVEHRPDDALAIVDRLLSGAAGPRSASTMLLRAQALAASGDTAEADAAYQDARRLAERYGPRGVLWRVAAGRSRLWKGRDTDVSDRESAQARDEIAALAGAIPDDDWRATFVRAAAVEAFGEGTRRRSGPGSQLTPREQDVAARVGRGLSNKAIAQELFIADKTVEMHVSNCLAKLGFTSRVQLAGWAVGHGLAPAPVPGATA